MNRYGLRLIQRVLAEVSNGFGAEFRHDASTPHDIQGAIGELIYLNDHSDNTGQIQDFLNAFGRFLLSWEQKTGVKFMGSAGTCLTAQKGSPNGTQES